MMKKYIQTSVAAIACVLFVSGCASSLPHGALYTGVKLPVSAADSNAGRKVGTATAKSYIGLIAVGDSSITEAKRNGGITRVSHVDYEVSNVLGFIGKYKTIVYGD